jgi:uncharacterized membrane protein
MGKERLEAFTDGVIAIVITIMILDMKVPPAPTLRRCGLAFRYFWFMRQAIPTSGADSV